MGKRKRAPSPKEILTEQQELSFGTFKLKSGIEVSKVDLLSNDSSTNSNDKGEIQDKIPAIASPDPEVVSDDRPTPQLRTSVRVQNKQKKEEILSGLPLTFVIPAKKLDGSSQDEDEEDDRIKSSDPSGERPPSRTQSVPQSRVNGSKVKRKRTRVAWSAGDKMAFFEAINDYGKDFEAIQNYLAKMRKKGNIDAVNKNKDQVRFFYYRTLLKISKYIRFSDDIKKSARELYSLINYGEMRKKVGGPLDERKGQKLEELIFTGSTSVRAKGKSVRVKTPICRALRKLNEIYTKKVSEQSAVRIPSSINVEIIPGSIESWNLVQGLAQNPRVRISCSLQKSVSSVIKHLQDKWRSTRQKTCDNLLSSANFPMVLPPSFLPKYLKLKPPCDTSYNSVNIKPDAQVNSSVVSLKSYIDLVQKKRDQDSVNPKGKDSKAQRKKKNSISVNSDNGKDADKEEYKKDGDDILVDDMSQEEECSDLELDDELDESPTTQTTMGNSVDNSSSVNGEAVVILSCQTSKPDLTKRIDIPPVTTIINEPSSPSDIKIEHHEISDYDKELLSAVKNIKKEVSDPIDTIHQLMALENVASSQKVQDDADVICIGESTRLSAQVRNSQLRSDYAIQDNEEVNQENYYVHQESQDDEPKTASPDDLSCSDFSQSVDRVKKGWTVNTAGKITIGELYLMYGKNQRITLEYEFVENENLEDSELSVCREVAEPTNKESSQSVLNNATVPENAEGISETDERLTSKNDESTNSKTNEPSRSTDSDNRGISVLSLSPPNSTIQFPSLAMDSNIEDDEETESTESRPEANQHNEEKEEKKKCAENISSMMARLLHMINVISSKGTSDVCVCGATEFNGPSKAPLSMRSPSSSRCLSGIFRSPSSTRSPRASVVALRSPKTPTVPSVASPGTSSLTPTQKMDKAKPSSAKRLLADSSDKKTEKIKPSSAKRLIGDSSDKISSPSAGTNGKDKSVEATSDKPSGLVPEPSKANNSSGGEFRVPLGPAPRNHGCQVPNPSFNAQLSKLLPRLSRPSRRPSARKQMVVQRQLPLLPRLPRNAPGMFAIKVGNLQNLSIEPVPHQLSLPLNITVGPGGHKTQTLVSADSSQTGELPILVQQPHNIPVNTESLPIVNNTTSTANAIFVNVSGQQLLKVEMPACPVSSVTNTQHGARSSGEITTGVASMTQFTVPTTIGTTTLTSITPDSLCIAAFDIMSKATAGVSTVISGTCPKADASCLSNIVNVNATTPNMPFISTSTTKSIGPTTTNFSGIFNNPIIDNNKTSNQENPSIKHSNAELLSLRGLGLTSSPLKSTLDITPPKCYSESSLLNTPTHINPSSSKISDSIISPIKLNLNSFLDQPHSVSTGDALGVVMNNSELNSVSIDSDIPEIHIPEYSDNLPILDISIGGSISIKEPIPEIAADTAMPGSVAAKPSSTIFSENPKPMVFDSIPSTSTIASGPLHNVIYNNPTTTTTTIWSALTAVGGINTLSLSNTESPLSSNVNPEAQLVNSGSFQTMGLSSLYFSSLGIGPTLSQASQEGAKPNVRENCVSTPVCTAQSTINHREEQLEDSHIHPFQESGDKILDFTLGNSNSNSCFTSLLAAAASSTPCGNSAMENSLLQTPPRPLLGESGGKSTSTSLFHEQFDNVASSPISPPSSPSRLLRQSGTQWIQNEANEFSLSSLLGSIESPIKIPALPMTSSITSSLSQSSQLSNLISTLNDNTVDFTATFARLKNQAKDKAE